MLGYYGGEQEARKDYTPLPAPEVMVVVENGDLLTVDVTFSVPDTALSVVGNNWIHEAKQTVELTYSGRTVTLLSVPGASSVARTPASRSISDSAITYTWVLDALDTSGAADRHFRQLFNDSSMSCGGDFTVTAEIELSASGRRPTSASGSDTGNSLFAEHSGGGAARLERVEDAVRRAFAQLLTGRDAPVRCQVEAEPRGPVRTVTDAMDVTQGKLAIGFRTGGITMASDDYPALVVCNALYGGSANSKLFLNVREKLSLCYYASSMLDKVKGLMVVSSGVEFAQFDRAQEAILDQLEAMRRGDFTQEELTAAIRTVTGSLRGRQDSQGQMEDDRLTGVLFHAAAGEDGELIKAVEAVTADQVAGAAQKLKLDTIFRLTGKEG